MGTVKNYTFEVPYSEVLNGMIRCYIKASSYKEAEEKLMKEEWEELDMEWIESDPYRAFPDCAELIDASCATCGEVFKDVLMLENDTEGNCSTCKSLEGDGLQDPETTTPDKVYG